MALVTQFFDQMSASEHADYTSHTVGYDYYFPPSPASVECALVYVNVDPGWASCAVIGATFSEPDGSEKPVSLYDVAFAQDLARPLIHFAVQLTVEKADATSLIRIGFWE
jgi:hypothetical protein